MHRIFRKALDEATGDSRRVIVVFIDIRDFSSFSQRCDSVDVAAFIRKVYMKLIDSYFDFASFYKSTGDGLLLTIPWEDKDLLQISQKVIESCIKCHSEFSTLFADDPSINFEVPRNIGIGVARGSACCLISGDRIIDYSGRLVNLTSRLTDIARPSGIVIDGAFIIDLLTEEQRKIFVEDNKVFLRGIAEDTPIKIYYTPEFTVIPKYNKQPIVSKRWKEEPDVKLFRDLLKLGRFYYYLESEPLNPDEIIVNILHAKVINGEVSKDYATQFNFAFNYKLDRGRHCVLVDFPELCKRLEQNGVKEEMEVTITVAYVEK